MQRYKVPFHLDVSGTVEVEAIDENEAKQIVEDMDMDELMKTAVDSSDIRTDWPEGCIPDYD